MTETDPSPVPDSGEETTIQPVCICPRFRDTGGFRIADLGCPIHGVAGTNPGDGPWEEEVESPRRAGIAHRDETGHDMAVIDNHRSSCAECDWSVEKQ